MSDRMYDNQPTMPYQSLINQWFDRSKSEDDIFTQFIFLYISFTSFLTQVKDKGSDRATIISLKNSLGARTCYLHLIQRNADLNSTINELIAELKGKPITNSTVFTHNHWKGTDGELHDEEDWDNLVEFWYRVRNNLFHGHKAPEFKRDKRLITYAYKTLTPLMEYFIEHDLIWEFD